MNASVEQIISWGGQRWRLVAGALLALVILVLTVSWGIHAYQANEQAKREAYEQAQPEYVLTVLDFIGKNRTVDINQYGGYFTPKGLIIWKWLLSQSNGDKPHEDIQTAIGRPVVNGNVCDIQITESNETITFIRLVKGDRWQFDDLYIDTAKGKKTELWVSYMHDHPYLTMLQVNGPDLLMGLLKGLVGYGIGAL